MVTLIAISDDNNLIITDSADKFIRIFNKKNKEYSIIGIKNITVYSVAISNGNKYIFSGFNDLI